MAYTKTNTYNYNRSKSWLLCLPSFVCNWATGSVQQETTDSYWKIPHYWLLPSLCVHSMCILLLNMETQPCYLLGLHYCSSCVQCFRVLAWVPEGCSLHRNGLLSLQTRISKVHENLLYVPPLDKLAEFSKATIYIAINIAGTLLRICFSNRNQATGPCMVTWHCSTIVDQSQPTIIPIYVCRC